MYFILQFPQLKEDLLRKTGSCLIINVKLLATDRIKIDLIVASYLRNTLYSEEDTLLSSLYTEKRDLLEYASANICQEKKWVKKTWLHLRHWVFQPVQVRILLHYGKWDK